MAGGDKKTYTVKEPVQHDGKAYAPGSTIELYPEQAQALKKCLDGDFPVTSPTDVAGMQRFIEDQQRLITLQNKKIEELTEQNAAFHKGLGEAAERIKSLEKTAYDLNDALLKAESKRKKK